MDAEDPPSTTHSDRRGVLLRICIDGLLLIPHALAEVAKSMTLCQLTVLVNSKEVGRTHTSHAVACKVLEVGIGRPACSGHCSQSGEKTVPRRRSPTGSSCLMMYTVQRKRWVKREVENTVCEAATVFATVAMEAAKRALRATRGPAQGRNPQPTHTARTGRGQGPHTHPGARENGATRV